MAGNFFRCVSLLSFWECKGKKVFLSDKLFGKNLDFFFFAFQFFSPPVEAGCKGTVLFSAFARGLENKFS